ncbi:MAG TPA: cytochrome c oxidase assembly protein [Solirubrobacteraceae bacterium]|nr:cytochrome c oxidase assembly protein [Solirubrobacteraceae bacterium]
MELALDPAVIVGLATAEGLYLRALRVLGRRGVRVPRRQIALFHLGIALWAAGLLSPIHPLGEELLSFHMAQHLLIADLAAPLLLAGVRNPVLMFLLPRDVLVPLARRARLRALFRTLRRPLVAIPLYVLVLYGWHFGVMFEAAVRHAPVHALQHASFIGIGVLVWWSVLEPKRRRLRPHLWKIGHILGARMLGMMLGMAFVFTRHPLYADVYGTGERRFGLSALHDQQLAGAAMITVDVYLMVFALSFLFYRAAQASAREEEREAEARRASLAAAR